MRIFVTAKAGARKEYVEQVDDEHLIVSVKEPAKENRANFAIMKALGEYFKIPFTNIRLMHGKNLRQKTFEIG